MAKKANQNGLFSRDHAIRMVHGRTGCSLSRAAKAVDAAGIECMHHSTVWRNGWPKLVNVVYYYSLDKAIAAVA